MAIPTAKYSIESIRQKVRFVVTYRQGVFWRFEIARGPVQERWWPFIYQVIPMRVEEINKFAAMYPDRVIYTEIVKTTTSAMYRRFTDVWFEFFEKLIETKPAFSAAEGKALKAIITHLTQLSGGSEDEALALWLQILDGWKKLDKFTQQKVELTYISSHINSIILQLRNGQTGATRAKSDADDLRQSL